MYSFKRRLSIDFMDINLLVLPKFEAITYSHNTIKYQGSKLRNNLSNDLKKIGFFVIF